METLLQAHFIGAPAAAILPHLQTFLISLMLEEKRIMDGAEDQNSDGSPLCSSAPFASEHLKSSQQQNSNKCSAKKRAKNQKNDRSARNSQINNNTKRDNSNNTFSHRQPPQKLSPAARELQRLQVDYRVRLDNRGSRRDESLLHFDGIPIPRAGDRATHLLDDPGLQELLAQLQAGLSLPQVVMGVGQEGVGDLVKVSGSGPKRSGFWMTPSPAEHSSATR